MGAIRSFQSAARRALLIGSALLSTVPAFASGEYFSAAWSADGNYWASTHQETQALADKAAVQSCNDVAPKKDCKVSLMKAVVRARGAKRTFYEWSETSVQDARSKALRGCADKDCKIDEDFTITQPGFFSVARTKNGYFFVAYGDNRSDDADKYAVNKCEENSNEYCRLIYSGAIGGKAATNGSPSPRPTPTAAENPPNCRPKTPTIRCSSQCTNGNCVITYENGCKINVQVTPQFDSFKNEWVYPAPSC